MIECINCKQQQQMIKCIGSMGLGHGRPNRSTSLPQNRNPQALPWVQLCSARAHLLHLFFWAVPLPKVFLSVKTPSCVVELVLQVSISLVTMKPNSNLIKLSMPLLAHGLRLTRYFFYVSYIVLLFFSKMFFIPRKITQSAKNCLEKKQRHLHFAIQLVWHLRSHFFDDSVTIYRHCLLFLVGVERDEEIKALQEKLVMIEAKLGTKAVLPSQNNVISSSPLVPSPIITTAVNETAYPSQNLDRSHDKVY